METRLFNMNALAVDSNSTHRFTWNWKLSDIDKIKKNGKTVFSCFSCGGGSSMGYKLAGYTVIGNCEIDPRVAKVYEENLHPVHSFVMDIRDFNKLTDLPDDLKNIDILDGSPPCSTFSMAGIREKGWGKEKVFREGQKKQTLDDLFFHFIETAKKLNPKVIVAENVKGLLIGNAKGYVNQIISELSKIGYKTQLFLLNAAVMGVPQVRERCFFIASRNDLNYPKLKLQFHEKPITFGEIKTERGKKIRESVIKDLIYRRREGDNNLSDVSTRERGKNNCFSHKIIYDGKTMPTITSNGGMIRMCDGDICSDDDIRRGQTFPADYNFSGQDIQYICGMSVPPVMMANIAAEIYNQWLI